MSDGCTDLARDQDRTEKYLAYLKALLLYMSSPNENAYELLKESAEACDAIPRGYWTGRTTLTSRINIHIGHLRNGVPTAWDEILTMVEDDIELLQGFTALRTALHPTHHAMITESHRILANRLSSLAYNVKKNEISVTQLVAAAAQMFADYELEISNRSQQLQTT